MSRAPGRALLVLFLASSASLASPVGAAAPPTELRSFDASYLWAYHGMTVALSELSLVRRDSETWVYSSRSSPRGIGHLFSERPTMQSVMRVTEASGVQPLSYRAQAHTSSTRRDIQVSFDWERSRVTGVYEDKVIDLPLAPGTQDDLSVQIALMVELLRGGSPESFLLLDRDGAREYQYTREGPETIDTRLGRTATIVYKSSKQYSPRVTRFWCDPQRGFLPLRVQQSKNGHIDWTLQIQSAERY